MGHVKPRLAGSPEAVRTVRAGMEPMKICLRPSDKALRYVLKAATLMARARYAGGLDVGARASHPMSQTQRSPAEARSSCLAVVVVVVVVVVCRHCSTFGALPAHFAVRCTRTNYLPERNQRKAKSAPKVSDVNLPFPLPNSKQQTRSDAFLLLVATSTSPPVPEAADSSFSFSLCLASCAFCESKVALERVIGPN